MTMDRLKDYVSVEDSRAVESYMASAITSYFEHIGYEVSTCCMPFVGSFKAAEETFVVKQHRKDKAVDAHPPFFAEEVLPQNKACQDAYARIIGEISCDVGQQETPPTDMFDANETIREDLRLLRDHLQTRYLLVVAGNGVSVPGLTSFAQGMATGMATGLLTGGFLIVTVSDVSYLDTNAAVIDLSEGTLLWSNSLRLRGGKVCKEEFYSKWDEKFKTYGGWVQSVFFHVPVKASRLIEAAKKGDCKCLEWVVLTGANLDGGDANRMTGLHWACQNDHLKALQLLAKHGANVDCPDAEGNTPLHYAVRADQSKMAKALLKLKANVHAQNAQGESPLDIARSRQNKKLVKMLSKYAKL